MLEVARIRSRTSSDTFLSRFPPFFIRSYIMYVRYFSCSIVPYQFPMGVLVVF